MYKIISHTNKSNLTYFSTSILISFTFPIALAQTSSTMLRKNREIGYVVLVLILWKCLSFFSIFMMLLSVVCVLPLLCWTTYSISLYPLRLLSWSDVGVCQRHFLHLVRWPCGFWLYFVYVVDYIYLFMYVVEPPLQFLGKENLTMWIIFLYVFKFNLQV